MPKVVNDSSNKPFRITSPPEDVSEYVLGRIKESMRSIPKELIVIIREHKQLTTNKTNK
jgi:hypothetical protein